MWYHEIWFDINMNWYKYELKWDNIISYKLDKHILVQYDMM